MRQDEAAPIGTPAYGPLFRRLKKRSEFQAVSRGRRRSASAFTVQSAGNTRGDAAGLGFTVTKKVGNAVVRNRIRRRLKAALRDPPTVEAGPDRDYVVFARREALTQSFDGLVADLRDAFGALARDEREGRGRKRPKTDMLRGEDCPLPSARSRRSRPEGEDRRP